MRQFVIGFLVLPLLHAVRSELSADEVTVYRDTWGVPHIYAETAAAGAYGLGYAQAEDRLDDIHTSLRTGMGMMSEAFGERFVDHDYLMRLCRNAELAEDTWEEMPAHLREIVEQFAAGVAGILSGATGRCAGVCGRLRTLDVSHNWSHDGAALAVGDDQG